MLIQTVKSVQQRREAAQLGDLPQRLSDHVRAFAYPRNFFAEPAANRQAGNQLASRLDGLGYDVARQGEMSNVVGVPKGNARQIPFVCGHFDSVPRSPGADDNASALAVMLEVARHARDHGSPVGFIGFNCEENGLAGSRSFVSEGSSTRGFWPDVAHVLEMVGYKTTESNSQSSPVRLPGMVPTVGDFIGVVANHASVPHLRRTIDVARSCDFTPKVVGLKTYFGSDRLIPDIHRSDHAPFWQRGIPSLMWTDTAEYRNPNYHQLTDTPDTLDYEFMAQVTLLLAAVVSTDP